MRKAALALLLVPVLAACAQAAPVLKEKSRVAFVSRQMGVPVTGNFGSFDADIDFDPDDVKKSRAALAIHLDSIDAGSDEATAEIKRKTWFDVNNHPRAEFISSSLAALGPGRYRVAGTMTIKGRSRPVSSDFTVRTVGGTFVFEGRFALRRSDFSIGEGAWSDTSTVADEVEVSYVFSVPAKAPKK